MPAWLIAALRRRWWLAALVTLVAACLALFSYASTPRVYVATQRLTIVLLPPNAATATELARIAQDEQASARLLANGGLLAAGPLDDAIAARLAATGGQGSGITSRDVATALTATHTGNVVTLSARWHTPGGAQVLVSAATAVLGGGALTAALAATGVVPFGASARGEVDGSPSQPALDNAVAGAARAQLLSRIALGLVTGLLLALGVELIATHVHVIQPVR